MKKSKYQNRKTVVFGESFDSEKEAMRWLVLLDLQSRKKIKGLERQVKYELIPNQRIDGRVVERACTYIADFVYYENGKLVVEDVKPTFKNEKAERAYKSTAAYKTFVMKRKLMLYIKGIRIKEI